MHRGERDELSLATRQLQAIDAWNRARRQVEGRSQRSGPGAQVPAEPATRRAVLRRKHQALVDRTHAQLAASGAVLRSTAAHRLVVVHRDTDFATRLTQALVGAPLALSGWAVDGADGVGLAVAEQPDVVLLEESPLSVPIDEALADLRTYCPQAGLVVQVGDTQRVGDLLRSGTAMVLHRQLPVEQVVARLRALVLG